MEVHLSMRHCLELTYTVTAQQANPPGEKTNISLSGSATGGCFLCAGL